HRVLDVPVLDLAPGAGELIPRADLRWVDDAAERADRLTERTGVLAEHDDVGAEQERADGREHETPARRTREREKRDREGDRAERDEGDAAFGEELDRKSTRLNSSHVAISYAVFCLKKKKTTLQNTK